MDSLSFTGIRNCFRFDSMACNPDGKEGEKKTLEVMIMTVAILVSFCAGVFVGALIVSGKDKPMVEEWETHWTKTEKKKV